MEEKGEKPELPQITEKAPEKKEEPKDEEKQVMIPLDPPKREKPEPVLVDPISARLNSVRNWTMQSPDWKLFNVLFELTEKEQLQEVCKNGMTLMEVFMAVVKLALQKVWGDDFLQSEQGDDMMTPVKAHLMSVVIPQVVNLSLDSLSAKSTVKFLELIDQAMDIQSHLRKYNIIKIKHFNRVQDMHL